MPTKIALAVAAALILLFLVYFFYLGCVMSEWRTLVIESGECEGSADAHGDALG